MSETKKVARKYQNRKKFDSKQRGSKVVDKTDYQGKKDNDLSWHAKSQTLLDAAAAIPWSWATGRPIKLNSVGNLTAEEITLPGICAIRTITVPGVGSKHSDAINVACQALYTDIRRQLKSANAYEASDVMIYIMGCGDVMQMISWMTRLYATTPLYSYMNALLPDALIRAQNVNPKDLHERATEFRSRINQLIYKASQIWVPKGFDYLTRAKSLYAGYYSEGESIKDQIYMFTPGLFRKFRYDPNADYAGALEGFVPIPQYIDDANAFTVDDLCDYLDQMIEALIGDSDFQNIAGDLYNCYGAGGVETFSLIPENAITMPAFSEEILEQMMNARCLSAYSWAFENFNDYLDVFSVSQDETDNVMVILNKLDIDISSLSGSELVRVTRGMEWDSYEPIIAVHKDPSTGKTMIVTRDTNVSTEWVDKTGGKYEITVDVASEIVVSIENIYFDKAGAIVVSAHDSNGIKMLNQTTLTVEDLCKLSNFHYYPILNLSAVTGSSSQSRFGELDIVAPITAQQLKDMNRVDLMSLLAVPNVGKVDK